MRFGGEERRKVRWMGAEWFLSFGGLVELFLETSVGFKMQYCFIVFFIKIQGILIYMIEETVFWVIGSHIKSIYLY